MLRTWKVAGKESANSRAQLFESHLQQKRATCLVGFFNIILGDPKLGKIEASFLAARTAGLGKVSGPRRVREWATLFEKSKRLPSSSRGKNCKAFSLLSDPDVCALMRTYLRGNEWATDLAKLRDFASGTMILETAQKYANQLTREEMPKRLSEYINDTLFPRIGVKTKGGVSIKTARRCMKREGFRYTAYRKGVYVDGHEREDIVEEYRQKIFYSLAPLSQTSTDRVRD